MTETADNFENSGSEFGRPKKAENLEEKSPKIQGVPIMTIFGI